ncbi:MAG: zinc-dependent dehydrogenase [Bacillota bacterium]
MLAAVFRGPDKLGVEEWPVPQVGAADVLVRVEACSVCGTDIRIWRGKKTLGVRIPSLLGHEVSGIIVEVGAEAAASGWREGERVAIAPVVSCGTCHACRLGIENACENRQALGYEFDGGFAEYVRVPAVAVRRGNLFRVPETLSSELAALAEPLACCINGQEQAGVRMGDLVVVFGAGPIGLMHLQLARTAGARRVIAVEPVAERRAVAQRLGADPVVDPATEDPTTVVKELSGGIGADVVILAVGAPSLVNQALRLARRGGSVNLFAGFSGGDRAEIDPNTIHYRQLRVTGATSSTRLQFQKALDLMSAARVDLDPLITHRFPLRETVRAFETAERYGGLKVVVRPDG